MIFLLMIIGTTGYFWLNPRLNPPGVITQRVAEKFLAADGVDLADYFSITLEGAKTLVKFKDGSSGNLILNGLTTLSPETAHALAQFRGHNLYLNGLTRLSDEAAKALAQFECNYLELNGLTSLSEDAAKALAQFKGHNLSLDGLTTLSPEAAEALAQYKGERLFLDGLTTLSPEAAHALAQFKGVSLPLNGLTTLSPEAAQALALFKGHSLYLNGLTTLSPKAAEALAQFNRELEFKGEHLHLDGLTTLSPEAAKALGQFKGLSLSLDGLTTLSPEVVLEFGMEQSGELSYTINRKLTSLVGEISYLFEVKKDQRYSVTISQLGNEFEESDGVIPAFKLVDSDNTSLLGNSNVYVAGWFTDGFEYIGLDFSRTAVRALEQLTETYGLVSVERLTEEKTKLTFTANTDGELQFTLALVAPIPGAKGSWEYSILFDHEINR